MQHVELETACHVAYYDPMSGEGRLALPLLGDDLGPMGAGSLHASDGLQMLRLLRALGIEPCEDEEFGGPWSHVGYRPDGREVVALYGFDPVISIPTLDEQYDATTELDVLAGLAPTQRVA